LTAILGFPLLADLRVLQATAALVLRLAIGGRLAEVAYFGGVPSYAGYTR